MKYVLAAVSLFTAARAAAIAQCSPDNCLRAVRASAFPTREGTADCSSYFRTTITPAIVTITATNTEYVTASATEDATATSTVYETTTETIRLTATDIVSGTLTVTNSAYEDLVKRQQTEVPSAIPSYASACSGAVRYSSACSCVGVTATTITLPASTVTVPADETVTQTTVTTTITVATDYVTVVDATNTVETTDATLTSTTIVATATDTIRVPLSSRFAIQIQGSVWDGQYVFPGPTSQSNLQIKTLNSGERPAIFYIQSNIVHCTDYNNEPITGYASWISNPAILSSYVFLGADQYKTPWPFTLEGDLLRPLDFTTPSSGVLMQACPPGDVFPYPRTLFRAVEFPFGNACTTVSLKAVQVPF